MPKVKGHVWSQQSGGTERCERKGFCEELFPAVLWLSYTRVFSTGLLIPDHHKAST